MSNQTAMSPDGNGNNNEALLKQASADVASLSRVSHRLAMIDNTPQLQSVLEKLLPRLLMRIGANHQSQLKHSNSQKLYQTLSNIHAKLVEILSHAMKRVREDPSCQLPCQGILNLFLLENENNSSTTILPTAKSLSDMDPFTVNLGLAFLTLGIPRCCQHNNNNNNNQINTNLFEDLLPGLLVVLSKFTESSEACIQLHTSVALQTQWQQVTHLCLKALEGVMELHETRLSTESRYSRSTLSSQPQPPKRPKTTNTTTHADAAAAPSSTVNSDTNGAIPNNATSSSLDILHCLLSQDTPTAQATYDLFLDVILYQTMPGGSSSSSASSLPPPGLAPRGHQRLIKGNSTTARDWAAEMAPQSRLGQLKVRLLDWIAPSRHWGLFLGTTTTTTTEESLTNNNNNNNTNASNLGLTRTLTLLFVAAGDNNSSVADRARTYLKQHLEGNKTSTTQQLYGSPLAILQESLTLSVGGNAAQQLAVGYSDNCDESETLGTSLLSTDTDPTRQQAIMAFRRRVVSENTYATLSQYNAKILNDVPDLSKTQQLLPVGRLTLVACNKFLSQLHTASGLSMLRGKHYVAAAGLLNALVVRLTSSLDSSTLQQDMATSTTNRRALVGLLAKAMSIACQSLSTISSSNTVSAIPATSVQTSAAVAAGSEGNWAVRDALYGIIAVLARSHTTLDVSERTWLFAKGAQTDSAAASTIHVSTDTAALLFACIASEVENLRPRAMAALDALLASYCRLLEVPSQQGSKIPVEQSMTGDEEVNPWQTAQSQITNNPWANDTLLALEVETKASLQDVRAERVDGNELSRQLLPLLWSACQQTQSKQSRVAAARWSSDLLMLVDQTNGSHLLCCIAGDCDVTASNIAREGLGLSALSSSSSKITKSKSGISIGMIDGNGDQKTFADFGKLVPLVLHETPKQSKIGQSWRPRFWEFTAKGKAATVQYLLECLLSDLYAADDESAMTMFLSSVCESLLNATEQGRPYLELMDECSNALGVCLSNSSLARSLLVSNATSLTGDKLAELALRVNSSRSRRLLANAWRTLYTDWDLFENDDWMKTIESALISSSAIIHGEAVLGHKHGSAFVAGACINLIRQHPCLEVPGSLGGLTSRVLHSMGNHVNHSDDAIGNAFADGITIACSYIADDSPPLESFLVSAYSEMLIKLAEALQKYGNGDNVDVPRVFKLTKSCGQALAASTVIQGRTSDATLHDARFRCVDALFLMLGSASYRKEEEVALYAGEALALYADAFSPPDVKWSNENSMWPPDLDLNFSKALPPHQQVLYILLRRAKGESSPQKRTSCAPALFAIVANAAKKLNASNNLGVRCLTKELCLRLVDIQDTFLKLLSDPKSKHLARESCCLGLVACKSLASVSEKGGATSEELNLRLLRAFGQTTNHGGSAMQETAQQAAARRQAESSQENGGSNPLESNETEVGGASGITEASLAAYTEMAAAAVSVGRRDILYALLMMSVSNVAWISDDRDYSPTALLGDNSVLSKENSASEMRSALRGHIGKLLPRILRGCHSPNKEARDQMQNLWVGLTGGGAEARATITKHLLVITDTLIDDSSNKLWRTRLGACSALAQVLVGRSWADLGGGDAILSDDEVFLKISSTATSAGIRLLRLWRVAMRAIDDVRINVREAGETLGRGVRSLTLRLVDPNAILEDGASPEQRSKHKKNASAAAATSLRWLIKHGLNQKCPEAAGVCISCLVGIVDVANPSILQPLVPDLLRALLLSMSSLEPAAFSYLQVRTAGQAGNSEESYDSIERLRIQVAQTGPLAEAVTKCMEMIPKMSLNFQKAVVPELNSAIRMSAGLTTRTAAADCVSTLSSTCPDAFRHDGQGALNPSVSLLRALYAASERERGQAARDKYAHACGNLAALCPGSSVRSLAMKAAAKYNASTGNNDDAAARKAAAITLRAIAVKASGQFSDGGKSDIWCRRVLPIAFLGMRDSDGKVASLFADVWEEGGAAANHAGSADGFGNLLEEKLLLHLVRECIKALKDVSWSRRVIGARALQELASKEILSPSPRSSNPSHRPTNLESIMRAKRREEASAEALFAFVKVISETRVWSGKQQVIEAFVALACKWISSIAHAESDKSFTDIIPGLPLFSAAENNDLFVGDEWFKSSSHEEEFPIEVGEKRVMVKDTDQEMESAEEMLDLEGMDIQDEDVEEITPDTQKVATEQPRSPTVQGICRLLLSQAFPSKRSTLSVTDDEILPFRASVLKALAELVKSMDGSKVGASQKIQFFKYLFQDLLPIFSVDAGDSIEPPLIVSRAIDAFASCFWERFGDVSARDINMDSPAASLIDVEKLVSIFLSNVAQGRPWTVKVSALVASERMVKVVDHSSIRHRSTASNLVEMIAVGLKDRKFWKVRLASLDLLQALVNRAGKQSQTNILIEKGYYVEDDVQSRQLVLESLLPQKERMMKLAKSQLSDSEAKITARASTILSSMSWWP